MTDRELRIHDRLRHDYNYVLNKGYEVFGVFLQGSQNYQLDYEGSDIDTKCVVLPSAADLILNKPPVSTTLILDDNSHIDLKDIRLMWQHFKKQNVNYIEILFTEFFFCPYDYFDLWLDMLRIREDIAHIDNYAAVNCIVGMVLEKNKALCEIDEPEDELTNEDSESESNVVIVSNRSNSSYYDPEVRKILNCYL